MRTAVGVGVLVLVLGLATRAFAQAPSQVPSRAPSVVLRESNEAAIAGDWNRVAQQIGALLEGQLETADLAEAHRLAGLAAFFQQRRVEAEGHFLAYLRIDLDGHLDPALYPPEVITFFDDVRARHSAELRSRRPKAKRYFILNFVPYVAQRQNGEATKGIVIASAIGVFAIGNVTSYALLRHWCARTGFTCDEGGDHVRGAQIARVVNITTGIGLIASYVYGVYDGVHGYRRRSRELSVEPFLAPTAEGGVVGVAGMF